MSDQDIIALLVKGRERFRQIIEIYRKERSEHVRLKKTGPYAPDLRTLREIERILAAAMSFLGALPEKPSQACAVGDSRQYVEQLLREIGDLLESVMVLDREMRAVAGALNNGPVGGAREQALRSYAGM